MSNSPEHLHRTADAIDMFHGSTGCSQTSICPRHFYNQTLSIAALKHQSTVGMMIANDNLALQHVYDIGIIPNATRGQQFTSDLYPINGIVIQSIQSNQRTGIVGELVIGVDKPGAASIVLE